MTLPAGKRLSRYEIRSLLGAGGMGEVYLAHDTQFDAVAIKILPAHFLPIIKDWIVSQGSVCHRGLTHPNIAPSMK